MALTFGDAIHFNGRRGVVLSVGRHGRTITAALESHQIPGDWHIHSSLPASEIAAEPIEGELAEQATIRATLRVAGT